MPTIKGDEYLNSLQALQRVQTTFAFLLEKRKDKEKYERAELRKFSKVCSLFFLVIFFFSLAKKQKWSKRVVVRF